MAISCATLTAYWSHEEATGSVRNDSKGVNHVTPTNTVSQVSGLIGNASGFSGTSYLSRASTADLTFSGNVPFSLWGWANIASSAAAQGIIWKGTNVSVITDYEWRLNTGGTTLRFAVSDGTGGHQGVCDTTATWTVGTTFFWTCVYDTSNLLCYINAGTPATTAYTWGSWAGSHALGHGASGNGASIISNGSWLDEMGVCNGYACDATDISYLYNSGAGRSYADICPVTGWGTLLNHQRNRLVRTA